jgi:hypothetical protein
MRRREQRDLYQAQYENGGQYEPAGGNRDPSAGCQQTHDMDGQAQRSRGIRADLQRA